MRDYSSSKNKRTLERFIHMLLFLKNYISGRADRFTLLRTIIVEDPITTLINGRKYTIKTEKEFLWTSQHEKIF